MARWNNTNRVYVYGLYINSNERELLCVISAYSLYFTSIGDVDTALDPIQWDYWIFWNWRWSCSDNQRIYGYHKFMVYDIPTKLTPFKISVLSTPKLISSISKAGTTTQQQH